MKTHLLDFLCAWMGCAYLSDLHKQVGTPAFRDCIDSIPNGTYSLSEWTETAIYLTGQHWLTFANPSQARNFLRNAKTGARGY